MLQSGLIGSSTKNAITIMENKNSSSPDQELLMKTGKWKYVVTVSYVIMNWASLMPITVFPLLYGNYLATLGDETSETAFMLQVFIGVMAFTGCLNGFIISKCGYRITGLIGAFCYSLGAFGEHVGNSFTNLVVCISILKAIGYGLMQVLSITVLTVYFDKKLNLVMGISQFFVALGTIIAPPMSIFLIEYIGIANTIRLYTGVSLINFPVIATFKSPVRRVSIERRRIEGITINLGRTVTSENHRPVNAPLLLVEKKVGGTTRIWDSTKVWILDGVGFRIFDQLKFWNIAVGLAMAYSSDILFLTLMRVTLDSLHYRPEDIAFMMMIFFVSDVVGRLSYVIMSGFRTFNSRYVFLIVNIVINSGRSMYFFRDDYTWKLITLIFVGWLRSFIETTLPLVISEEYKSNFPIAFSMYNILLGSICLISSPLTSFIKTYIGNDAMVVYVNSGINYVLCSTWILELLRVCRHN